jgi:putative glutathione S-transferase
MGMLIDGEWRNIDRAARKGAFVRRDSAFRDFVSADGSSTFPAEAGRYHLYVSLACPWASRTIILRKLKRLETVIGMTVVSPDMLENGWTFIEPDPVMGFRYLYQLYAAADARHTGPATVPVLWDKRTSTIVNNESSEIIRMLNHEFDEWGDASLDFYPHHLAGEIDALNARIYETVNNGVYKAGFATKQAAYEAAVLPLFAMLDELEQRLAHQRFLFGSSITETDIRLFTTLVRFDTVYYSHFKCNIRQLRDYPNLDGWLRDMAQTPGIAETIDLAQIKRHYYGSQLWVNPTGIIPIGPEIDLLTPHDRNRFAWSSGREAHAS